LASSLTNAIFKMVLFPEDSGETLCSTPPALRMMAELGVVWVDSILYLLVVDGDDIVVLDDSMLASIFVVASGGESERSRS